jgi:hypothetical protein
MKPFAAGRRPAGVVDWPTPPDPMTQADFKPRRTRSKADYKADMDAFASP